MKILYSLFALCAFVSTAVQADITAVDGTHFDANQVDYFSFNVDTAGAVNLYTSSGAPFNPLLTLWTTTAATPTAADWTKLAFNDDTTSLSFFESGINPKDAQIKLVNLNAGTYLASVTGFGYSTVGNLLSDGFTGQGTQISTFPYQFTVDTDNVSGLGVGASVSNVLATTAPAAVPLPAAVWLFGSCLMGFLGFSKRKGRRL
jgi:hypothetical protein